MKKNQKGFSVVEGLLILIIVGIIGFAGWYVWHSTKNANASYSNAAVTQAAPAKTPAKKVDSNAGYLVMKEWGLRFKVPSGLSDVRYVINGDTAAFYAKPTGSSVQYRSDYDKLENGNPRYATGVLLRSTDSTKDKLGTTVDGKKLGNYYYYTYWAFSSMATGAGCTGLYGDDDSNCQPESTAFHLVNQGDDALLNTISLAQ